MKRDLQTKVRNNDPSVRLRELIGKSQIFNGELSVTGPTLCMLPEKIKTGVGWEWE